MEFIDAKTIIANTKYFNTNYIAAEYNMNIYTVNGLICGTAALHPRQKNCGMLPNLRAGGNGTRRRHGPYGIMGRADQPYGGW